MAKRGRQKNPTGNSKRPPALSLKGATATKLSSVRPGLLDAATTDAALSAKLQLLPNASKRPAPPANSVPPAAAPGSVAPSDTPASLEAARANTLAEGTPSPISFDLATDRSGPVEVDEFEEAFFSSLPPGMRAPEPHDDHEEADARMARLHEPDVVARRDRMRRFVAWGLAACAVVFFLAVGRAALRAPDPGPAYAAAPQVASVASVALSPAPAASAGPTAPEVAPSVAAPAPALEPPAVALVASAAAPQGDAKGLRAQAQRLLETGKTNDAIAIALESTTVEPEHAGGWLLLGAAYQTRGRNAEARQAFLTCVKSAKRGPRGECAAMLR